jgi:hypothetical protein
VTDVNYKGGGRWTVTHWATDYAVWEQPGKSFSHRGSWAEHCTLCQQDLGLR